MTKEKIIESIRSHATKGFIETGSRESAERRIHALAEIEYAAQEAREALEEILTRD